MAGEFSLKKEVSLKKIKKVAILLEYNFVGGYNFLEGRSINIRTESYYLESLKV